MKQIHKEVYMMSGSDECLEEITGQGIESEG